MNKNVVQGRFCAKAGFTLIELLVVVLIIGILVAIAVPQYQVAVTKTRYATLKNLAKSIADAQEVFYLANGKYATDFEELDISLPGGKLDTSANSHYKYNWGSCQVAISETDPWISCKNNQINMIYQIYPLHNPSNQKRNKRLCSSYNKDLNSPQVKVCRQETGKENYDWDVNDGLHWFY